MALLAWPAPAARAAAKRPAAHTKAKGKSKHKGKGKGTTGAVVKATPALTAKGKVAVFAFAGDGVTPVRREVLHVLQVKGLKVVTTLRPVDSPAQYREMAETLDLMAYVDGEVDGDADAASATIHVRSGASGLRIASATVSGDRRKLPAELGKTLWDQIGAPLARASADAALPHRHERAPLRIEAGTPLANPPAEPEPGTGEDLAAARP